MSEEGPEWFSAKRYGYGAGPPISWQGWALTLAYVAIAIGLSLYFKARPLVLIASVIPVTVVFCVIAAKTTKGGWRWRWGDED